MLTRRMPLKLTVLSLAAALLTADVRGEDKAAQLRDALQDEHALGADLWIYNNIAVAREEARAANKPLFVTFRCVPCKDCAAFDAEVAQGSDTIAKLAAEHFIPVRQVEMKGVDLSQFQFDYDLNWAALFLNADGTVYARYGTQSAAGADAYNSIEGLQATMLRVLELHKNYPGNAAELKEKRGEPKPYQTAMEMPGNKDPERFRGVTTRKNCIHCHMLHDFENLHAQSTGTFTRDMLWRYPLPENVGMTIDGDSGVRITTVEPNSPAARAGLQAGEDITHMNGQAITSIADMQWVLHPLPNTEGAQVRITGRRTGEHTLSLPQGWKESDFSWRGSMWTLSPRFPVWTPELSAKKRQELKLPEDSTPLEVRWINTGSPGGLAAKKAGLQQGDIIVAVNGRRLQGMTAPQFNMQIKLNHQIGDELALSVLRGGKEHEINVELVE